MSYQTIDHIEDTEITEDDVLVVRSSEAGHLYPGFKGGRVFTVHSLASLQSAAPRRIFLGRLGVSRQAWDIRAWAEAQLDKGAELYRLYEDGTVIGT
ncbi:hypothetical protein SEA_ITZA_52 [Streptomyces phage Itza]|nr:hypothetical protein SEA_URZA_51 [Streptomyces phage Urza]QJD50617.1 hypothetical protein SEA_ITZA_52 [Streptomyces phage Itza]